MTLLKNKLINRGVQLSEADVSHEKHWQSEPYVERVAVQSGAKSASANVTPLEFIIKHHGVYFHQAKP